MLASQQVRLAYCRRDTGEQSRPRLHPYGILSGSRNYLIGFNTHPNVREHRLYVLANIEAIEVLDRTFERDPSFDLRAFAARSFGAFWDGERFDVEWRFKPHAAADARTFRFHPEQVVTEQPDGSVVVTFAASGLTEMAWHLFTWGDAVEIIKPEALKVRYREWLTRGFSAVSSESVSPRASETALRC
jgi:predicted DNA-binding transcriptional regulator YafY